MNLVQERIHLVRQVLADVNPSALAQVSPVLDRIENLFQERINQVSQQVGTATGTAGNLQVQALHIDPPANNTPPRTKLGTVAATVLLMLVPNCSDALVTKMAQ